MGSRPKTGSKCRKQASDLCAAGDQRTKNASDARSDGIDAHVDGGDAHADATDAD